MNQTIEVIKNHRSIRNYLDKEVPDLVLEEVLKAAQAMPTSINGQQISIIVVKDQEKRTQIAKLTGEQAWIAQAPVFLVFVADFYKTHLASAKNGAQQLIHESIEGTLVGTFDAGLAMGAAIIAAESLGLGIVPIGAIRKEPEEMIKLLDLPEFTYPVAGLVVGYPANLSAQKPRLPYKALVHEETYQTAGLKTIIDQYDDTMKNYYSKRGDKESNWSTQIANVYQQVYFPKVYPSLKKQGFKNDK